MTKTTNYQLNQWAKSDRIMMDDFNADNLKIDAALKAVADQTAVAPKLAAGWYPGAAADGDSTQNNIDVGFPPKAVFICVGRTSVGSSTVLNGLFGLATREKPIGDLLVLTDSGFAVRNRRDTSGNVSFPLLNSVNYTYNYIAVG